MFRLLFERRASPSQSTRELCKKAVQGLWSTTLSGYTPDSESRADVKASVSAIADLSSHVELEDAVPLETFAAELAPNSNQTTRLIHSMRPHVMKSSSAQPFLQ